MSRRLVAVLCLAAALAVSGCGGGGGDAKHTTATRPATTTAAPSPDTSAYHAQVSKVSAEFATAATRFRDAVGPTSSPQSVAAALGGFQAAVKSAADSLARLHPPAGAAGAQAQLVSAFRAIAAACQPTIDAGRAGDRRRLRTALSAFQAKLNGSLGARARDAATRLDAALARGRR
ncbi:MAG: hypothetical protein E6G30_06430 [Actinobacteria bacterium]|nr:MAG: hypothetical protein E6G30_06430 [Actinomycetota bacterium]